MSMASDMLLKETAAKVAALERLCETLRQKVDYLSAKADLQRTTISLRKPKE